MFDQQHMTYLSPGYRPFIIKISRLKTTGGFPYCLLEKQPSPFIHVAMLELKVNGLYRPCSIFIVDDIQLFLYQPWTHTG
jgi:hypothetical protein